MGRSRSTSVAASSAARPLNIAEGDEGVDEEEADEGDRLLGNDAGLSGKVELFDDEDVRREFTSVVSGNAPVRVLGLGVTCVRCPV